MKSKSQYTKYEMVRVLSTRALQISQGAPVLVNIHKSMVDPLEIAKIEWEKGVIPIDTKLRSTMPSV